MTAFRLFSGIAGHDAGITGRVLPESVFTLGRNMHWDEFFHDDAVAVPIIDRVIHHSHIFMLGGESYV